MNSNLLDKLNKANSNNVLTYIDLCCGIGSFHYSMNNVIPSSKCVMACDIWKPARDTYIKNYNQYEYLLKEDLKDINYNKIDADILFSGNPCQAFSQIGKHKGFEDERGDLFNFILDNIVSLQKYNVIVFENVHGLYTHDKGDTFKYIINYIEKCNYYVYYRILLCSDYGIPQNRKRIFIICLNKNKFTQPYEYYDNILNNILHNNINKDIDLTTYLNNGYIFERKIGYTIRCGGLNSPIDSKQNWDGYYVSKKVANDEVVNDKEGNRYEYRLSIKDMKRLQGFDNITGADNNKHKFKLIGTKIEKKKLLGNSIPTNLTKLIAMFIKEIYNIDNK